ncbi:response regulator [Massilia aquatica]|uniref:Response regulator n=1 Tax=Massilia aquatica TaxID=2609000 RepID=A0ABX0M687_9BURK|nr:response regulator [Massilia aquatica]NHZ42703.1 response regulator [Massilia aquatica]
MTAFIPTTARGRGLRIMLVDDNVDAADMLSMLPGQSGHQVWVEHTAQAALERTRHDRPHVCLLDLGLPDASGYELAQQLRAMDASAGARLVAVTGYGQEKDRAQSLAAGFDYHLVKPVDIAALGSILAATSPA